MFLTVFTPTYNRGDKLSKAYESLRKQTFKDFEWLIIDDGSTDNTEEVVQSFIKNSPEMNIRYYKIEHGGKHFAMNKSYEEAKGEFYFSIDSDDELYNEYTLELLYNTWNRLTEEQQNEFSGIGGYFIDQNNNILGQHFDRPITFDIKKYLEIVFENKYTLNIPTMGKTHILKSETFPEIKDKYLNYFPEWIIWMRMYTKHNYKLLIIPDSIYRYYLNSSDSVSLNTPKTKALFYQTLYQLNEWYPIFKDKYPEFFRALPQTLHEQAKLWHINTSALLKMLTPSAKKYYFKRLYISKIFSINFSSSKIEIYLMGIKISWKGRAKNENF